MSFLDDRDPDWTNRHWQELLNLVSGRLYRMDDIDRLLLQAGISPSLVNRRGNARDIWFDAIGVANGQLKRDELITAIREDRADIDERLDELAAASAPTQPKGRPQPDAGSMVGFGGAERQIVADDDTLLDIAFLEQGLHKAASVCRLTARFGGGSYHGSGFRIAERLLLTNHHVLFDWDRGDAPALAVEAWFDFELSADFKPKDPHIIDCDAATILGVKQHDWAIVSTSEAIPDRFPVLPLEAAHGGVAVDDRVYIIQHPDGARKKIGMHHNLVRHVDDDVIQYWTDTSYGSSGSPVFDRHWELVGLHHYWLTTDDDEHAFRNQGRRIERVIEGIEAAGAT